jgi:uncharacterized membrane protein (DUF485 family)
MEKDTKLTSLRWIIWTSRSALFHNWIMGLSFGIYLACIVFALFGIKFPLNAINFPTYIGVSVTGLSFTLALIVAVRNIFTSRI